MPFDFPGSPYIGQTTTSPSGSSFVWDGAKWTSAGGGSSGWLFLPTAGGSMTGPILLAGDPATPTAAATKRYVDMLFAVGVPPGGPYLPTAGGAVTGPITLAGNATLPMHAVPLQQLNSAVAGAGVGTFLPLTGGTVTGATTFSSTLTAGASTFNGASATSGTNTLSAGSAIGTNNIIRLNPAASGSHTSVAVMGPDTNTYLNFALQGAGYVQVPRLNMAPGATTLSGPAVPEQTPFNYSASFGGTATDNRNLNLLNISSDNAVVPVAANGLTITHTYGGAAMKGGRNAFNVNLVQGLATQNTQAFYQAVNFSAVATQPDQNGSTPALAAGSAVFAIGSYATLNPGAHGYGQLAGYEQDIIVGAQPYQVLGINVVRLSGGFGTLYQALEPSLDTAYRIGSALNTANWINGYTVTSPSGQWAIDPVQGTLFKAFPGQGYSAYPPAAKAGIDLSYVAFSGAAYHSRGAIIDGSGNATLNKLSIGNWSAAMSSSGLALDTVGNQVALSAAAATGGTGYNLNEQFSFAGNGRGIVTAQSGGVVSAFTILEYPTAASPPANPVATASLMFSGAGQATGSGLTLTLTWSAASTLSLNHSGQQILTNLSAATTDAAAATAGVPIGGLYNNAGVVHVRLT